MGISGIKSNQINLMAQKRENQIRNNRNTVNIEAQKLDLVRLRIRNKFYDREEIMRKVVHEMYENDLRNK